MPWCKFNAWRQNTCDISFSLSSPASAAAAASAAAGDDAATGDAAAAAGTGDAAAAGTVAAGDTAAVLPAFFFCDCTSFAGVRGANVEEVGATDIEETKLPTPVLRIYEASVVPCPQLRPTIVACSLHSSSATGLIVTEPPSSLAGAIINFAIALRNH